MLRNTADLPGILERWDIHSSFTKGSHFIHHCPYPLCYDVLVRKNII